MPAKAIMSGTVWKSATAGISTTAVTQTTAGRVQHKGGMQHQEDATAEMPARHNSKIKNRRNNPLEYFLEYSLQISDE